MEEQSKQTLQELISLLKENQLSEIEYATADTRFRVSKTTPASVVKEQVKETEATTGTETPVAHQKAPATEIKSPMVGLIYLSPNPDAKPFVKVGDTVSVGQTLCLIEAMKTYSPIKATVAGKITEVLVETGAPVEYAQPLFRIQ